MLTEAAAQVAPVVSEARTLDRFIAPAQEKLWALARNLWWSWDRDSTGLFRDLDPVRWRELNHNPVSLLSEIPLSKLERRAGGAFPLSAPSAPGRTNASARERFRPGDRVRILSDGATSRVTR